MIKYLKRIISILPGEKKNVTTPNPKKCRIATISVHDELLRLHFPTCNFPRSETDLTEKKFLTACGRITVVNYYLLLS